MDRFEELVKKVEELLKERKELEKDLDGIEDDLVKRAETETPLYNIHSDISETLGKKKPN